MENQRKEVPHSEATVRHTNVVVYMLLPNKEVNYYARNLVKNFTLHEFHFLLQVFPGTLLPHTYANPQNPDHLLARSEVERRRDYIQLLHGQLPEQHPLVQLVHQCLHNTPARRPSAMELLQQLEVVRAQIEGPYGSQLKKVDVVKVGMMKALWEIESLQEQVHQLEEVYERVLFYVQLSNCCFYIL